MPLTRDENQLFEALFLERRARIDERFQQELAAIDATGDLNRHGPLFNTIETYAHEVLGCRVDAYMETFQRVGKYATQEDFDTFATELGQIAHRFLDHLKRRYASPFISVPREFVNALTEQLSRHLDNLPGLALRPLHRFINEGRIHPNTRWVGSQPEQERVLISIHGIRTRGAWQKAITPPVSRAGIIHEPLDFGFFSAISLLFPFKRRKKVCWFVDQVTRIQDKYQVTPSVLAHSFGSYLVGGSLLQYPEVRFDRIILTGSILPTNYPWRDRIAAGQCNRVLNDVGHKDLVVRLAEYCIEDAGPSGSKGFEDDAGGAVVQRHYSTRRHSDSFYGLNYQERWIPFLQGRDPVEHPLQATSTNWKFRTVTLIAIVAIVATSIFLTWKCSARTPSGNQTVHDASGPGNEGLGLQDAPVATALSVLESAESETAGKWLYTLTVVGKGNQALDYARRFSNPVSRAEALAFVSQGLSKLGNRSQASAVATLAIEAENIIYNSGLNRLQLPAVVPIAQALVDAGRTNDAIEFAQRYKAHPDACWAFCAIAKGLKCAGKVNEAKPYARDAIALVDKSEKTMMQPLAKIEMIRLLANLSEIERALELVRAMNDPLHRYVAMIGVARELFYLGDKTSAERLIDESIDFARQSPLPEARLSALIIASKTFIRIGQNKKALETAIEATERIPSELEPFSRFGYLNGLSGIFQRLGRIREANSLIDEAVSIARLMDVANSRATLSINAADTLLRCDRHSEAETLLSEAVDFARRIPADVYRSGAMLSLVRTKAKLGEFESAVKLVDLCSSSDHKVSAYAAILRESFVQKDQSLVKLFEKDDGEKDWPFEIDLGCSP